MVKQLSQFEQFLVEYTATPAHLRLLVLVIATFYIPYYTIRRWLSN